MADDDTNLRGRLNRWLLSYDNEFTFNEEELQDLMRSDIEYVIDALNDPKFVVSAYMGTRTIKRVYPYAEEPQPVEEKAKGEGKVAPGPIVSDTRIFSHERYHELVAETVKQLEELGRLKGGEYAGDTDRLANFRRNAERMGVNMETIWGVYTAKHWDAIMQFVTDLNTGKTRPRLESLASRADDIIVYMVLFKAILEEREKETTDA